MPIPHLDALRSRLRSLVLNVPERLAAHDPSEDQLLEERVLNLQLEQLPYNLRAATDALARLEHGLNLLAASAGHGIAESGMIVLTAQQTAPVAWAVDAFLDASRRAQNAVMPYIKKTFRRPLPSSLHDFVRDIDRHRAIPNTVRSLVTEYWFGGGKVLKEYRDLVQHHVVLASDGCVQVFPDRAPKIQLLLPTNPGNKKLTDVVYDEPFVHVGPYCRTAFVSLYDFSCRLVYLLLRYTGWSVHGVHLLLRHPMGFLPDGFAEVPSQDLRGTLEQVSNAATVEMRAKFGALDQTVLSTSDTGR